MKTELIDGNNSIRIDNFAFSPYDIFRVTFDIYVTSGSFSGYGECEYHTGYFSKFVSEMQKMYDFKRKSVTFKDICYGSEIIFTIDRAGHVVIKGTVYADAMEHSMTFCFNTDQSALLPFINGLKKMIEKC